MSQSVEPGSTDAQEIARWTASTLADKRQRGHEPADPASLPAEEPGSR
jgi:hypothetical protein